MVASRLGKPASVFVALKRFSRVAFLFAMLTILCSSAITQVYMVYATHQASFCWNGAQAPSLIISYNNLNDTIFLGPWIWSDDPNNRLNITFTVSNTAGVDISQVLVAIPQTPDGESLFHLVGSYPPNQWWVAILEMDVNGWPRVVNLTTSSNPIAAQQVCDFTLTFGSANAALVSNHRYSFVVTTVDITSFAVVGNLYLISGSEIYVAPKQSTAVIGDNFDVRVNISNVAGVAGYGVTMQFDPTLLVVTGWQSGGFLETSGVSTLGLTSGNHSDLGWISLGDTLSGPGSANGNGTLVILSFRVRSDGSCMLHFSNTVLVDQNGATMDHIEVDGSFGTFPIVHFSHETYYGAVGENVIARIIISNAVDLFMYQVFIDYSPEILSVVNVTEGDLLRRGGAYTTFWIAVHNDTKGLVQVANSLLRGGQPVTGNGEAFEVTFKLIEAGTSALHLHDVVLANQFAAQIVPVFAEDSTISAWMLPTVESCDYAGMAEDSFSLGEPVCVRGSRYMPSGTYDLYVVNATVWSDGMLIPQRVAGTATEITLDVSGNIATMLIWSPLTLGNYDIVVDVNKDGCYNSSIDALDKSYVQISAGFEVIPEFPSFLVASLLIMATLTVTFTKLEEKRGKHRARTI